MSGDVVLTVAEREALALALCRWWEPNDDPEQACSGPHSPPCAACAAEALFAAVARIVAARVQAAEDRGRAEVTAKVRGGLTRGKHLYHDSDHWVALSYVLDLLDAALAADTPAQPRANESEEDADE